MSQAPRSGDFVARARRRRWAERDQPPDADLRLPRHSRGRRAGRDRRFTSGTCRPSATSCRARRDRGDAMLTVEPISGPPTRSRSSRDGSVADLGDGRCPVRRRRDVCHRRSRPCIGESRRARPARIAGDRRARRRALVGVRSGGRLAAGSGVDVPASSDVASDASSPWDELGDASTRSVRDRRTAVGVDATAPTTVLARLSPPERPVLSSRFGRNRVVVCPRRSNGTIERRGADHQPRPARQPDDPDPTGPGRR